MNSEKKIEKILLSPNVPNFPPEFHRFSESNWTYQLEAFQLDFFITGSLDVFFEATG